MLKDLITSKTVFGIALAIVAILLDVNTDLLPKAVVQVLEVLGFIIGAMGLRDTMLENKGNLLSKLIDFKSKTFYGAIIAAVALFLTSPDGIDLIPEQYVMYVQMLGGILTAIGWRSAAKRTTPLLK